MKIIRIAIRKEDIELGGLPKREKFYTYDGVRYESMGNTKLSLSQWLRQNPQFSGCESILVSDIAYYWHSKRGIVREKDGEYSGIWVSLSKEENKVEKRKKANWKKVFKQYSKTDGHIAHSYADCLFCKPLGIHCRGDMRWCVECPVAVGNLDGLGMVGCSSPCFVLDKLSSEQRLEITGVILKKIKNWDNLTGIRNLIRFECGKLNIFTK